MTKRFFLVLLAMLLALSVFTACDDDDDKSRAATEDDLEIIESILDACDEAMEDEEYCTISYSGTTATCTFKAYSCYIDDLDTYVTIKSGSTLKIAFNSSSTVETWNINATVDFTSHSLYMKVTYDDDDELTSYKIKLDGVELTGLDDIDSAVRELAARTLAV